MKGLVGITCCRKPFGLYAMPNHAASDTYVSAVDELVGAVPVLIPANGAAADIPNLISRLDGIILTGSRSNVDPGLYGGTPHPPDIPEDPDRDGVTLPLIRAAIADALPVLAICRGFQELNVALGGTLHQRLQDLPGRLDHSTPILPLAALRHGKAHRVSVVAGSWLHRLAGCPEIAVNSLHNQGIDALAPGLEVEATAPDGTIEAVRVVCGPAGRAHGFAVGMQWHPEYDFRTDPISRAIFIAFAKAVRERIAGATPGMREAAD